MWFNPSALLKIKIEPLATSTTFEKENSEAVPESRKVAKVAAPLSPEYYNNNEITAIMSGFIIGDKNTEQHTPCDFRDSATFIKCRDCLNFKCFNAHGNGAGTCLTGVQPSGSCWWGDTLHQCEKFDTAVEWIYYDEPQGETVTCFTPIGKPNGLIQN